MRGGRGGLREEVSEWGRHVSFATSYMFGWESKSKKQQNNVLSPTNNAVAGYKSSVKIVLFKGLGLLSQYGVSNLVRYYKTLTLCDEHRISPCDINVYSVPEVMRIKDMII